VSDPARQRTLLLVEDDQALAQLVGRYLEGLEYRVLWTGRGDEVVAIVNRQAPDLVILDLGLPGKDGLAVCRELRPGYEGPILMLTARGDDLDQVLGLELGADDYVIKPVEPRVLAARIQALLRRWPPETHTTPATVQVGRLSIGTADRSVKLDDTLLTLSRKEFQLLLRLALHAGVLQNRDALFRSLYGREYDGADRTLDILVSRLRRKLGPGPEGRERIKTLWGEGYLLVPDAC